MRTVVIGCGAAGSARVAALGQTPGVEVIECVDQNPERAKAAARILGCKSSTDWQRAIALDNVEAVVIATATNTHAPIAIGAMEAGKHVLCESPIARTPAEAEQMLLTSEARGVTFAAGAGHRFTSTARRSKEILESGTLGRLLFLRGWSGQGSWGGVETWYADPELSGGGTMMSNGIVLLDLARWFAGEFEEVIGYTDTALWPIEPVEDNAFGLFRTSREGRVAALHSSWTQWKDLLRIDLHGSEGYLEIDLSEARIVVGTMSNALLAPEEQLIDLSAEPDVSHKLELEDYFEAARSGRKPDCGGYDGLRAVQMAHALYLSSEKRAAVAL